MNAGRSLSRSGRLLRRLRRTAALGYTIVELMMSLSVLAIGVSGVIAMQRVTLATNRHAKDLSIATRIGEAWIDQLTADGMTWTTDGSGTSTLPNTVWLKAATPNNEGSWDTPVYSKELLFGPAFGPLGQPRDPDDQPQLNHFCAHIRLAFLQNENGSTTGNGVIRAQVRVFWLREDQATAAPSGAICKVVTPAAFAGSLDAFHMLYLTTSIRELPAGRKPVL
jgi:type IV pilus assembly protein PilV